MVKVLVMAMKDIIEIRIMMMNFMTVMVMDIIELMV